MEKYKLNISPKTYGQHLEAHTQPLSLSSRFCTWVFQGLPSYVSLTRASQGMMDLMAQC